MPHEFPPRIHGDGRLFMDPSFFEPLKDTEKPQYMQILTNVLQRAKLIIPYVDDLRNHTLSNTLLTIKQRFMIGFSNGCPWPEKAICDYIEEQKKPIKSLEELRVMIEQSGVNDARRSMLFQFLLHNASPTLKEQLLSYHPRERLEMEEEENLPNTAIDPAEPKAYGMANDPFYFKVIVPLSDFTVNKQNQRLDPTRYSQVLAFLDKAGKENQSIFNLIKQTEYFLEHPDQKPIMPIQLLNAFSPDFIFEMKELYKANTQHEDEVAKEETKYLRDKLGPFFGITQTIAGIIYKGNS